MADFTIYRYHTTTFPLDLTLTGNTGTTFVLSAYTPTVSIGTQLGLPPLITVTGSTIIGNRSMVTIPYWTGATGNYVNQLDLIDADERIMVEQGVTTVLPALPPL